MSTRPTTPLDELRFRLAGGVHEPGDPQYEETCALFNAMIATRPALVVRCVAPEDVVAALAFARERGLPVAVRAGGHSVAGLGLCEGGVVLDVRPMCDVEVDPVARVARVGGGATAAHLDRATQPHGLATTGGRVSTTGVAGLTLGGGSGWLERKHGLACDNLIAVELVTADGRLVRASADENPELLWALRGGGGNFGVVTALELALHPVGDDGVVFGGLAVFAFDRGPEVLACWREVMRGAPDELSLAAAYVSVPEDDEDAPEELRGGPAVLLAGMHAGSLADGEAALAPIRALGPALDGFGPVPYDDLQCSLDDPPGFRNWWTAESLRDLTDEVIDVLHGRCAKKPEGPAQIFLVAWGGEVARRTGSGPLSGRDAGFVVHPLVLWEDPADDDRAIAWGRGFRDDLREHATGGAYLNFTGEEGEGRVRAQYGAENHARLARVKREWDPEDVFRASGHVAPEAAG